MKKAAAFLFLSLSSKVEGGSFSLGGVNFPTWPTYPIYPSPPPPPVPAPTGLPTLAPSNSPTALPSIVPSTVPRTSGLETCCDAETNECRACEWLESRSCQELLDQDAICGGDCCAFEDAPGGGCKWSTGGNGYCCVTTESGNFWNLQHVGDNSCPVSQYPTPTATPQPSIVPSTVPRSSGLETCCDEATDECRACEWFESRSCQELLDQDAICGGDCCALEDAPDGGCKWSTGGNGSCCVTTEGGNFWNLQHVGDNACPVSQYSIP